MKKLLLLPLLFMIASCSIEPGYVRWAKQYAEDASIYNEDYVYSVEKTNDPKVIIIRFYDTETRFYIEYMYFTDTDEYFMI